MKVSLMVFASDILYGRTTQNTAPFAGVAERFRLWREYRRTINELSELSNSTLADLGITRGEITSVAREAIYGKTR